MKIHFFVQCISTIPMVVKGDGSIKPTRKYAYGIRLAVKLIVLYMLHILYTEAKVITGKRYNSTYHYKDIGKCNSNVLRYSVANLQSTCCFAEINVEHYLFPFGVKLIIK